MLARAKRGRDFLQLTLARILTLWLLAAAAAAAAATQGFSTPLPPPQQVAPPAASPPTLEQDFFFFTQRPPMRPPPGSFLMLNHTNSDTSCFFLPCRELILTHWVDCELVFFFLFFFFFGGRGGMGCLQPNCDVVQRFFFLSPSSTTCSLIDRHAFSSFSSSSHESTCGAKTEGKEEGRKERSFFYFPCDVQRHLPGKGTTQL